MEKSVKAVFYKYKYYIFPDGVDIAQVADGTVINAKRLKEERCMAPDFIYESIVEESVEVECARLLFPVTVNLYTGKEYDAILSEQVDRVCHGCSRFNDDGDESLDGHHREISLEGVCYERETDDDKPTYALRTYWFLSALADNLDAIKKCIDTKNGKKLNKICKKFDWIPLPYKFYGAKADGKYRLFWRSFGADDVDRNVQYFTAVAAASEASPIKENDFEIIPFIPKGADVDLGKFDENAPLFSVSETRISNVFNVHVYSKKRLDEKKYDKLLFDVHRNICKKAGEDFAMRTIAGYDVIYDAPANLLNLEQLLNVLKENDVMGPENHYPEVLPIGWEKQENALYGRRNYEGATSCYTYTGLAADLTAVSETDFYGCLAYAYLFVPATLENYEKIGDVLANYLANAKEIPEPIIFKDGDLGCFVHIGAGICMRDSVQEGEDSAPPAEPARHNENEGLAFDFLVTDENAFFRFIKILAPVLQFYNARLVVANGSGVNEYRCGYKIMPADSTDMN